LDHKRDIFLSILEDHKGIIYKIVNSYCRDAVDRQDLIQEIIIQLWVSLDKYKSQYKRSTWVYRIALNTSISFYRKNKTLKEKTIELSPIFETSLKAEETTQENQDIILLRRFVQELPKVDKALMLLYLDGLAYKEISEIMGITPTNVSTKITRIKKKLKKKFHTSKSTDHARR